MTCSMKAEGKGLRRAASLLALIAAIGTTAHSALAAAPPSRTGSTATGTPSGAPAGQRNVNPNGRPTLNKPTAVKPPAKREGSWYAVPNPGGGYLVMPNNAYADGSAPTILTAKDKKQAAQMVKAANAATGETDPTKRKGGKGKNQTGGRDQPNPKEGDDATAPGGGDTGGGATPGG